MDSLLQQAAAIPPSKKPRLELPLKKRYHRQESIDLSPSSSLINRNCSPAGSEGRASSDDSALPKTPCSAHSSACSIDLLDECSASSEFALDFSLPTRSRATIHADHHSAKNGHRRRSRRRDQHADGGSDHGFESASSTSSVASSQDEPLDLTHLDAAITVTPTSALAPPSVVGSLPVGLFAQGFLPFALAAAAAATGSTPSSLLESSPSATMLYPNFAPSHLQSFDTSSSSIGTTNGQAVATSSTSNKRPRPGLSKQQSQPSTIKKSTSTAVDQPIKSDRSTSSALQQGLASMLEQFAASDESEEDMLMNKLRRNYKNMTVERRMEANARERTRVHTIGAAFDRLRKLIPSSTSDQKLSKLSILRIACRYIMLLASMNGLDYSLEQRDYTVEECIEMMTDTINVESKFKRVP